MLQNIHGLLFAVVFSFGAVSLYYMNKIAEGSKNVLKDNYKSLEYSGKMRKILDVNSLPLSKISANQFSIELKKETTSQKKVRGEAV